MVVLIQNYLIKRYKSEIADRMNFVWIDLENA